MLHVRPRSMLSEHYEIRDASGPLTEVDIRWFREAGTFALDGERYRVGRHGLMSGEFFVEQRGAPLATAEKPSALLRRFAVHVDGRRLVLAARSPFLRAFDLREGLRTVGSVEPTSWWRRAARADLPEDIPLPARVFLVWLVLVLWRRTRRSSS